MIRLPSTPLIARLSGRVARVMFATVIAGASLTTAACSNDSVTAPAALPNAAAAKLPSTSGLLGATTSGLTLVKGVTWKTLATPLTVSAVIGANGGKLEIAGGLTLEVPKGAVNRDITFSITRLPGPIVAYDFQPHGITFAVPVQLEQRTQGTSLEKWDPKTKTVRGAYFLDPSLLNPLSGTAFVSELRPTTFEANHSWIRFTVDHFSGYMVSMD